MVGWENTNLRQTINNREHRVVDRGRGGVGKNRFTRGETQTEKGGAQQGFC